MTTPEQMLEHHLLLLQNSISNERAIPNCRDLAPESVALITDIIRMRDALQEAAEALAWAARQMKGNCRGSDIDAVNLASGNAIAVASRAYVSKGKERWQKSNIKKP